MRALVVYESMYGNTHAVADKIAEGLRSLCEVTALPVGEATARVVAGTDLLVCGGPTHVHGLSSSFSRKAAADAAAKEASTLVLDAAADGPGFRDWLRDLAPADGVMAAAFDTRLDAPAALTGRASRGLARRLRHRGFRLIAPPVSFVVDKENRLLPGEAERATAWGARIAWGAAPASDVHVETACTPRDEIAT